MVDATPCLGWGWDECMLSCMITCTYSWPWRYSHIPHDLNVNECMTKLGHLAANSGSLFVFV